MSLSLWAAAICATATSGTGDSHANPRDGASAGLSSEGIHRTAIRVPVQSCRAQISRKTRPISTERPLHTARANAMLSTRRRTRLPQAALVRNVWRRADDKAKALSLIHI